MCFFGCALANAAAQQISDNPLTGTAGRGAGQREATKITDNIYQAIGFGTTFLIITSEGNVIVETSGAASAPEHVRVLKAQSSAPAKYIILIHRHGDHTGGIALWKEAEPTSGGERDERGQRRIHADAGNSSA
jgi:glyoxylase-like metal-dependent hydrolase (beta-lactamase superfamily II)